MRRLFVRRCRVVRYPDSDVPPVARTPAVLLLLRSGAAHGYDLARRLSAVFPGMKTPKDAGLVYRALKGLEADGAVRSHWDHSERKHSARS
ncbi:PadR family transcriptional regulator [Pseudonocardia nigra]|uniref:PadR family transcriptional regulator n=1 Tax=Pseudonocardia nigra TaxID=1921578 RepID=UPI0035564210